MKKFNDATQIGNFVKGKIAELLFEMMIREDENHTYTIIPFGYEKTTPELAQFQELIKNYETLSVIRKSPDYILIKNDKTEVHFVEVKYRKVFKELIAVDMKESAENMLKYWQGSWIFLATQNGFYFDSGVEIVRNNGAMRQLNEAVISKSIQDKYLSVLKRFIPV